MSVSLFHREQAYVVHVQAFPSPDCYVHRFTCACMRRFRVQQGIVHVDLHVYTCRFTLSTIFVYLVDLHNDTDEE